MQFDQAHNAICLQGPEEIRSVLAFLPNNAWAVQAEYEADETVSISLDDAYTITQTIESRLHAEGISDDEWMRLMQVGDALGACLFSRFD